MDVNEIGVVIVVDVDASAEDRTPQRREKYIAERIELKRRCGCKACLSMIHKMEFWLSQPNIPIEELWEFAEHFTAAGLVSEQPEARALAEFMEALLKLVATDPTTLREAMEAAAEEVLRKRGIAKLRHEEGI